MSKLAALRLSGREAKGVAGDDRGAMMVEYGGLTMVAALIITGVLASNAEQTLNDSMRSMVCLVEGPECDGETWVEADRPEKPEEFTFDTSGSTGGDNEENKAIGQELAAKRGWTGKEFECLEQLWHNESNWDHNASNPSSGAHGIPQALPGEKMSSHGSDWQNNPETQIEWGLDYIEKRYDTPCGAWAFWQNPSGGPAGASANWY